MKVLHINAGLESGGGLTHIINLLSQAKKEGQNFELLVLAAGPVARAARQRGITTHVLGTSSRYDLASLTRLKRFINHGHYQIVHTHGARANLYLSLIHRQIGAKWCLTVHSDPYLDFAGRGLLGKIFTRLNLHALRQADLIFAVTKRFASLLEERDHIPRAKVQVIYNGIFFHSAAEIPAKLQHPYFNIVNVARAEKVKGQALLLKALKKLDDQHVRLHIAGSGSQMANLQALARGLHIAPQVTFHGFMTHQQLTSLYRRMDLAVLTSYSESFPLVLLEASDNQLPILSTAVGDIHMMIPDRHHGFIAQVGSVASITNQLKQAVQTEPRSLAAMARQEKAYLAAHFNLARQLHTIEQSYRNLLS